jgi:hypothetical protein
LVVPPLGCSTVRQVRGLGVVVADAVVGLAEAVEAPRAELMATVDAGRDKGCSSVWSRSS